MDLAEARLGGRGRRFHAIAVGDIDLEGQQLGVAPFELVLDGVQRGLLDIGDDDSHSGSGE